MGAGAPAQQQSALRTPRQESRSSDDGVVEKNGVDNSKVRVFTPRVFAMGLIVSIGGLIFGYDTGQISGFLEMSSFLNRFGNKTDANGNAAFTDVRSGTIVGLLSIGTLIGAVGAAPIADKFGRRITIIVGNLIFCVGVIVQISTSYKWYQIVIGRWVAGLGVGILSVSKLMCKTSSCLRNFLTLIPVASRF